MGDEQAEVRGVFERLMKAWTDNDAEAYGQCFTDDADYIAFDGSRATGRQHVVDSHDKLFRGVLKGSALNGEVESVRFPSPDVAVLIGTGAVLMPWRSSMPKRRVSRQTIVLVRTPEGWRITALQNGRVRPLRIPDPGSVPASVSHRMTKTAARFNIGRARDILRSRF